jgi:hypothetical protein
VNVAISRFSSSYHWKPVVRSGLEGLVSPGSTMLVNDIKKTRTGKKLSIYRKEIKKK